MANSKLISILSEIITEVGDLQNIQPYQWSKINDTRYDFQIKREDETFRCSVTFTVLSKNDISLIKFNPIIQPENADAIQNVTYSIEGEGSQYLKSDFKLLIRVLKTVSDIIEYHIQSTSNTIFVIFEETKSERIGSAQKSKIYQAIMTQNMLPGYRGSTITYNNTIPGYCISPIYK